MADIHHFWLDQLIGREKDINVLFQHYQAVKTTQNPRMVCLIAESGVGKTRVVREFYQRLRQAEDNNGYWPTTFSGDLITLDLNPDFSGHIIREEFSPNATPFIWWAARFSPDEVRNRPIYSACALVRASSALLLHLNYLAKSRLLSEDKRKALDLLFDVVVEFGPRVAEVAVEMAMPWSGLVGLSKSVALKFHEATKQRRELKAISEALSNPGAALKQEAVEFQEKLLTALEAMLSTDGNVPGMPIVMVLDDLHWADPDSIEILQILFETASENRWPLLILATVWPAPWAEAGLGATDTPLASFRSTLRAISQLGTGGLHEIPLTRIDDAESIVGQGLPGLAVHQRAKLMRKFEADLFALDLCIAHFRGRPRLFVDGDITKSLTERGESELESFVHPRIDVIQKRFEALETEIKEILGCASYQGFSFLEKLVVDVSHRLAGIEAKANEFNALDALGRAENPACFIQHISPSVAKFVDPANFDVVFRWLSDVPKDVESVRKATLDEIDAWIERGELRSLSWIELDDFLTVARRVLMDSKIIAENATNTAQINRLQGELNILEGFFIKRHANLRGQGVGLTNQDVDCFERYRSRVPFAWQSNWVLRGDSLNCLMHTPRPVIEKLRDVALRVAEEATFWFIQNQSMGNVDVVKDAWRAVVSLTTSLFNFSNIFDPAWNNPENEWDLQYTERAIAEYQVKSSTDVVKLLDRLLFALSKEDNQVVRVARLRLLLEKERMTGAFDPSGNTEVRRKILDELSLFPESELGHNDVLENLFDGVLPTVMYGFSNLHNESMLVVSRLIRVLKQLDSSSAGTFQLVTLACACQVFGDRDLHLDEDSAPYFEKAFELSLEIIKRGLPTIVLDWLDISARISCAATFRGNEARRWQARKGTPAADYLSRGWKMAQDTAANISEAAVAITTDQLEAFYAKIIGSMSRYYLWSNDSSEFERFVTDAQQSLGVQSFNIRTICAYIWSLDALNASINDAKNRWDLLESAYRAAYEVPPAFYISRGGYEQHQKCYESIKNRIGSAPKPDRLFHLTASACISLVRRSGKTDFDIWGQCLKTTICNLIDASNTLVAPYKEWAEPVVKALTWGYLTDASPHQETALTSIQNAWEEYLRHTGAVNCG